MSWIEILLAQPAFQALGWAIVHSIWQGALVAAVLAGALGLARRRGPDTRYALACAALALLFALPVGTFFLASSAAGGTLPPPFAPSAPTARGPVISSTVAPAPPAAPVFAGAPERAREALDWILPWLVLAWFAGVLGLSLRFLGGWALAQRLRRLYTRPAAHAWETVLSRLADQLGVRRPVRLLESALADVPTVVGWLRPVILVPTSLFVGLSPQQIEALLAHELAHVRRHDYLVNLLQTAVETLLFYHPAVWWISDQIREEREHCCDDLAVSACGDALAVARALAGLEELRAGAPHVPTVALAATGGSLLHRIERLLGAPSSRRSSPSLAGAVVVAAVLGLWANASPALPAGAAEGEPGGPPPAPAQTGDSAPVVPRTGIFGVAQGAPPVPPVPPAPPAPPAPLQAGMDADDPDDFDFDEPADGEDDPDPDLDMDPVLAGEEPADGDGSSFIDGLAELGYTNLSVDDLTALKNHGVSPTYIREMSALGYGKLSVGQLVSLRVHGVTPAYVGAMKAAGYGNLTVDQIVSLKTHGVSPTYIRDMTALGYPNLSLDAVLSLKIQGVSAAYVKEMRALGFGQLSSDDLVSLRIHGVSPAFVREIRALGYASLTTDDFVSLRVHGVSPAFVREMREAGYPNLTIKQLLTLRIHGVTPGYVKKLRERGFTNLSVEQLVKLRNAGM